MLPFILPQSNNVETLFRNKNKVSRNKTGQIRTSIQYIESVGNERSAKIESESRSSKRLVVRLPKSY